MLLILFAVAVLFIVNNVSVIWKWLGTFVTVAMPFIIGFCIAYIINKPYVFFSDKMLAKMDNSKVGFIKNDKKMNK